MQATKFITLGTAGGPVPKLDRASPAHAIVHEGQAILVDCGEGAFRQLRLAGIDFRDVHELFITHHHFDHIGSLFACLGLNMMTNRCEPINLYGPPGAREIVDALVQACDIPHQTGFGVAGQSLPHPRDFIQVAEITPGDVINVNNMSVSCCENTHYRTEDQFGQAGPLSLSLRFDASDRSMVFTGDTGPCRALEDFAKGAQLLVGEMIDVDKVLQRVRQKNPQMPGERFDKVKAHMLEHHLKPEELGELAMQAGVEHVVAVHLPMDSIDADAAATYERMIASKFSGKISISEDLASY